ncbi:MAG: ABC transporter substrate-binding protein [Dehalococcoidia bacterium]|nr:ABC transporter substrate-binding protein [Dehalococcoidia bacterium]
MDGKRAGSGPMGRRRFLGLAGSAAASAALVACGGGKSGRPLATGATSRPDDRSPRASPSPTVAPGKQGETLRYSGFVQSDRVYDPHKTQAGPFYGQQALVFSRLLAYESQIDNVITPDLATGMPQQPDAQTFLFSLNPAARWHDQPPLNGRPVTAEDVKFSIERQMNGDPSFVHKAKWANVDRVEAPDAGHVIVSLKSPFANMLGVFADVNAFVVAPQLVDGREFGPDNQVGSGPFRWLEWSEGKFASVVRNPHWHGGGGRPYLDGVSVAQPKGSGEIEAGLRTKQLDAVAVGRPQADKLGRNISGLVEQTVGHSLFFGMRFFIPQVPFNDQRFRSAVAIALDRRAMVDRFFAGSGGVNPWVSWPIKRWTLPESELTATPGYRPGAGGRAADIKEAKDLLAAVTAEKTLPESLALFVVEDAEKNLGMGSLMKQQLLENLGLDVAVYAVPIGDMVKRLFTGDAPWAAGPDNGWVDLDDWLYPYFHSAGTNNSFPLRDAELDALIVSQRAELDEERRRQIGFEAQRRLLLLNAGVNFVSERVVTLSWPYVRNFPLDASDGYQHRFADCWIDRSDPTLHGR